MFKFKEGQTVKCIDPVNPRENPEGNGGGGWKINREFRIGSIKDTESGVPILWPEDLGSGVFEDYVEAVECDWDEETN